MSFQFRQCRPSSPTSLFLAATLALGLLPAYTQAQNEPETVVVTGSRIRTDPLNQAAPLITLTSDDIEKSGLTSVGDILQRLPISGGGLNTRFNTSGNIGFPPDGGGVGAGASTADLRHLGPKRVLILVDGVRWVHESSATGVSSAVDLNTIPASIIDHIEVLQDGASSIYGSDAIAGVINIITKKDYDGIEFNAYGGQLNENDGEQTQFGISTGARTEKVSAFLNLAYVNQEEVSSADREISQFPTPGIGACTNRCSSGTPQGRFFFTDPNTGVTNNLTINTGVGGLPLYDPTQPVNGSPRTDDFHAFATEDRFNFQPFNFIQSPSQRISIYGQAETQLTADLSFYAKGLFNNRKSTNQAAPEPIFVGPEAGNGLAKIGQISLLDQTAIDVNNPFNPLGFTLNTSTDTATGGTDYFIGRRPLEGGPRVFNQNVDTWYLGGGFRGGFAWADRDFYWDVNAVWSRNRADQETHGSYNAAKIQQALGPGGTDANGTLVCGDPDANGFVANPLPGCVPLNLFGGQGANGEGTITPEMLAFISPILHDSSEQELKDFTANFTGTIVEMPAGGLDFAVGAEHRDESGFYTPDAVYQAGESAGVPSQASSGSYDVTEYYGEIRLPILKDKPGANLLQLSAALRTSDYSTFGSDTTSKFGLNWRPFADLLFRGSFAEGLRAPGVGELFGTFSRFDATLFDPCSDYTGLAGPAAPANIQANCQALGVPASYTQFNSQISVITGGNIELTPETSDGTTLGFVYSPSWAEGKGWSDRLSFEATWYKIEITDAIQARDAQAQLDGCVETLDDVLCGGITRTGGGVINTFLNTLINIGGTNTEGYDFNLRWLLPTTNIGTFGITWQNTFLTEYTDIIQTASGFTEIDRKGTERGDPSMAFPEYKTSLTADWSRGAWGAAATLRYTDSVTEPCQGLTGLDLCSDYDPVDPDNASTNELDATTYIDAQVNWAPTSIKGWTFTLGVNNLLDEDPPFCFSCALNSYDASTYDIPGVFYYARVVAHYGGEQ